MLIQIGEDDGLLHTDGIPALVVLTVSEGDKKVTFPFPASMMISDIYSAAKQALGVSPVQKREPVIAAAIPLLARSKSNKIEKGDTVIFNGIPPEVDSEDLVSGKEYQVLLTGRGEGVDIVDTGAAIPYRYTVLKRDLILKKKAPPVVKAPLVFEKLVYCFICKTENVLSKLDGKYLGYCDLCGESLEEKNESGQEKTANVK